MMGFREFFQKHFGHSVIQKRQRGIVYVLDEVLKFSATFAFRGPLLQAVELALETLLLSTIWSFLNGRSTFVSEC
jgi:hypothetical protein